MTSAIKSVRGNGFVTISIDRAPVNALAPADWAELRSQIEDASNDIDVRAIVLHGGEGRFCAGADIRVLTEPCLLYTSPSPRDRG